MNRVIPLTEKNIRILGRHDSSDRLFYTGSGVDFCFKGSEIEVELEADFSVLEPWISVFLNGNQLIRVPLGKGVTRLPLFRGLDPDLENRIQILRETQVMQDDESLVVYLRALHVNGTFVPPQQVTGRIEFIGDSITSGEGTLGTPIDTQWLPIWFSAGQAYPFLTAQKLNMDFRIISQSGWGAVASYDSNPEHAIPLYYDEICSVVSKGPSACDLPNDFAAWQPDVVVCALGANDTSALNQEAVEGGFHLEPDFFEQHALEFLQHLRKRNPNAFLIWMMWGYEHYALTLKLIQNAMDRFVSLGDTNAQVFVPPHANVPFDEGVRNHPNRFAHAQISEALYHFVCENRTRKNI